MSKVISFTGEHLGHAATIAESVVAIDRLQAILDATVIIGTTTVSTSATVTGLAHNARRSRSSQ